MDNRQAIGYMLLACKQLGYSKDQARKLLGVMYCMFDLKTEEEAENQGYEWYYDLETENGIALKKNDVKPLIRSRKITRFPADYRSEISKENEKLIKILRATKVEMSFPIINKIDSFLKKIDKNSQ
ncbi:hypothetical protein NXY55_26585 [Aeromonas veronii]|nr:hypothetical protein [Aeromonas veronii]